MTLVNGKSLVRHLLIIEESRQRKSILLEKSQYSIGRKSNNSIALKSHQVSRQHATLLRKAKTQVNHYSYWIFDGDLEGNKSHNGIYVNGEKCLIHELKDGDLINFGCEVNASYHILYNSDNPSSLTNNFNPSSEELKEVDANATDPNSEQSTILFISEPHLTINTEDTLSDRVSLDALTQLPNRNLFHEYLSIAIGNASQNKRPMAILYFDIDKMRDINQQFGNLIGNKVLQEFGKQLKNCLRSGDIVARWGGDEFTILLPQINAIEDIPKICQRVLNSVRHPLKLDQQTIEINTHVGVAIYPQDGDEEMMLLQKAEANLEENKQQTQHQTNFQKPIINLQTSQLSKIETLLLQALQKKEFSLYYQPQINIKTKTVEGIEALLRWHHPQFGAIAPTQFIPWVEKLNLIIPLTEWIIETVCRQHQAWRQDMGSFLPVSINLSPHQLQHRDLLEILTQILSDTGLDPNLLIIEITEKTLLENPEDAFRVLHELKQLGVKSAIDDFGSGYTAVRHLQQFPFKQVKIAQSVLQDLKKYPEEISMIAAVIALGHTFNLKVIAEGVETQKQLDILRKLGCEVIQGYLFSQPLNEKDATQFLSLHHCISNS